MEKISELHKIRPAARIINTIGDDLIKDAPAAILELVKNSYDADSKSINIKFFSNENKILKIEIVDLGHGMDFNTVINKWMVPATKDKLERKYSPKGRLMQGRKGIGRYAAAFLGEEILMETIDVNGNKTIVFIDWREFDKHQYLEDIDILVESFTINLPSGTRLEITGGIEKLEEWNLGTIDELIIGLRKLLSPLTNKDDEFLINIEFVNFFCGLDKYGNSIIINEKYDIEPFPIINLYDYRLSGKVSNYGKAEFIYENKSIKGIPDEVINYQIDLPIQEYCGKVNIDLRVFDRDPESLENTINKGLFDPQTNQFLSKPELRKLLDNITGISIYRDDFRIRPYGEPTFDWLELDKQRVQDPSFKIGHNQVLGFINIEPEEKSKLEEKSARDGLKENKNYIGLKEIVKDALQKLELRRYDFRKKTGKGRKYIKLEKEVNELFNFDELNKKVSNRLAGNNVNKEIRAEIEDIIKKEQKQKSEKLEEIKMTIAIYQGQATLGKIVMVILHEGRKPISYFRNQSPIIISWIDELNTKYNKQLLETITDRLTNIAKQTVFFVNLFDRLKPLAVKKRAKKKDLKLKKVLNGVIQIFENEIKLTKINVELNFIEDIKVFGWEEDFYILFSNLFENSIYWLKNHNIHQRRIRITVNEDEKGLFIDFVDNGPGIEKKYIENDLIFEPGFSTKTDGTGLGLAIAGEAIERNNGILKAIYSENGAYFRIEIKLGEIENE